MWVRFIMFLVRKLLKALPKRSFLRRTANICSTPWQPAGDSIESVSSSSEVASDTLFPPQSQAAWFSSPCGSLHVLGQWNSPLRAWEVLRIRPFEWRIGEKIGKWPPKLKPFFFVLSFILTYCIYLVSKKVWMALNLYCLFALSYLDTSLFSSD